MNFFEHNVFVIDEKVAVLKFVNDYKIFDNQGVQIGVVEQLKISAWHKILRLVSNLKPLMPFTMHIKDMAGNKLVTLQRGWTFWRSKVAILDGNDYQIATLQTKFKVDESLF